MFWKSNLLGLSALSDERFQPLGNHRTISLRFLSKSLDRLRFSLIRQAFLQHFIAPVGGWNPPNKINRFTVSNLLSILCPTKHQLLIILADHCIPFLRLET